MSCPDAISFTSDQKTNYNCCSRYRSPARPPNSKSHKVPHFTNRGGGGVLFQQLRVQTTEQYEHIFGLCRNIFNQNIFSILFIFRLYGAARVCARCHVEISCNDLVMKARHCVFHVECFKCATCDTSLRKGKLFTETLDPDEVT